MKRLISSTELPSGSCMTAARVTLLRRLSFFRLLSDHDGHTNADDLLDVAVL